ncbi:MAG: glycosyltransferase family 2 protein [Candidatus Theseobacter exili]|nr:glycosyltransferase family 2 protein [Candidatus Theseobacter exili]
MDNNRLISIIIPVLDEAPSLEQLYQNIIDAVKSLHLEIEIIFIDDGSSDNSFQIIENLHAKDPRVKGIEFRGNFGKSAALSVGFKIAKGDIVFTMDADLQDDPSEIPTFLEKIDAGYDLVSGWKKKRNDPLTKVIPSRVFNWVVSRLSGVRIHDFNCGIKAYRNEVVKEIEVYGELHRFIPALAAWRNFKIGEIIVRHHKRKFGKSKYGARRFLSGINDLITVMFLTKFQKKPSHLFSGTGVLLMFFGFLINLYILYLKLNYGGIKNRFPLLFLGVLLMIVGVQLISTGLIAEMLTFFHNEEKKEFIIKKTVT